MGWWVGAVDRGYVVGSGGWYGRGFGIGGGGAEQRHGLGGMIAGESIQQRQEVASLFAEIDTVELSELAKVLCAHDMNLCPVPTLFSRGGNFVQTPVNASMNTYLLCCKDGHYLG